MDLPVPATVIPQATPVELRKLPWLYPHFVSDDDATLTPASSNWWRRTT
jgi:hypothetical protein